MARNRRITRCKDLRSRCLSNSRDIKKNELSKTTLCRALIRGEKLELHSDYKEKPSSSFKQEVTDQNLEKSFQLGSGGWTIVFTSRDRR